MPAIENTEQSAYEPVKRFLRLRYFDAVHPFLTPASFQPILSVTANRGRSSGPGTWSIPDLVAVQLTHLPLLNQTFTEVHSFEVKLLSSLTITSTYEAHAQTRRSHYGNVVVYSNKYEEKIRYFIDVEFFCEKFDLGLIFVWGGTGETKIDGEIRRAPGKQSPFPENVEIGLSQLLDDREKKAIGEWSRRPV